MMECSLCGKHTARHKFNYCPNCGAKMDLEEENNDDGAADIADYHPDVDEWTFMGLPITVTHWMPLPKLPEEVQGNEL